MAKDGTMTVSVDVANTGNRAGDEVVQLYVKHLGSKVARPREELKGFRRITVEPGGTKTVEIPLKASELAYWDEKLSGFEVEAEPVEITIGSSSTDIKANITVHVE
jgi:beta-glucosidase